MSMSKIAILAGAAALLANLSPVFAHGVITGMVVDSEYFLGYDASSFPYMTPAPTVAGWTTDDQNRGFVAPDAYASEDIICHKSGTPGGTHITVAAGGSIELQWSVWPAAHQGPVLDYLANCNGECESVDKTSLEFFKIAERGLINGSPSPGTWGSTELFANNNSWTVTIPSSIKAGNYVLRHEVIALHQANDADGAQNYPQCINLEITGSGTQTPPGIPATELYTATDPGIFVNIYYPVLTNYTIPGPPVFSADGSASPASSAASTAASSATSIAASIANYTVAAASTSSTPMSFTSSNSSSTTTSVEPGAFYPMPTTDSATAATSSATVSDVATQVAAASSTAAATPTDDGAAASTTPVAVTYTTTTVTATAAAPTDTSALEAAVTQALASATYALPTVSASTNGTAPATGGFSKEQLIRLCSDVLTNLYHGVSKASVSTKERRHPRDIVY